MRRVDKVRELLSKSVQEKYLKQLHLLINQTVYPQALNTPLLPTIPARIALEASISTTPTQVATDALQIQQQSIAEKSKSVTPSVCVPIQIPQPEQNQAVPTVDRPLFVQIDSSPVQIPFDVQLIIAEFVGVERMAKAAATSHAFNKLKCAFFAQKNRKPTEKEVMAFVKKKQNELKSLKVRSSDLSKQSKDNKNDKKSPKEIPPDLIKSELSPSTSIEIALCWLLIQLCHISTMTVNADILRQIAFLFHDAYLCLQQNYKFTLGTEVDFEIHTIALRAELAWIRNHQTQCPREGWQHRLLDNFEVFYSMLTNNANKLVIAAEVVDIVKSFKESPEHGLSLRADEVNSISRPQLKQYLVRIQLYKDKWDKEHRKQLEIEARNNNCQDSNHGITHAIKGALSSVLRM